MRGCGILRHDHPIGRYAIALDDFGANRVRDRENRSGGPHRSFDDWPKKCGQRFWRRCFGMEPGEIVNGDMRSRIPGRGGGEVRRIDVRGFAHTQETPAGKTLTHEEPVDIQAREGRDSQRQLTPGKLVQKRRLEWSIVLRIPEFRFFRIEHWQQLASELARIPSDSGTLIDRRADIDQKFAAHSIIQPATFRAGELPI